MFGLKGKFQRRRESDFEQEYNLTSNPKNGNRKSKNGILIGYKNGSIWSASDWNNNTPSASPGHPVEFEVTNSSNKWLLCMLIIVSLLLLLFIIAVIIAYATNVLTIKNPFLPATTQPCPFITSTPLPDFTRQPYLPIFPTPLPPYKPKPIITTLPTPTDRLQKQTFLCQFFVLNQANEFYIDHNGFEYRQTLQMIQNALRNQLKQTALQPYLEDVYVWYLYNSGLHLGVEFSIILLIPTHTNIGLTTVKNVLFSILPEIENQLNGIHIERNSISVQYLYN